VYKLVEEGIDTALQCPYYRRRLRKTGLGTSLQVLFTSIPPGHAG
jgi:hypothetical protein